MTTAASSSNAFPVWAAFLITFAAIAAYMVPSIVGYVRHVRDFGSVVVVNVFLGWSGIGWVVALAMALRTAQTKRWAAGQTSGPDDEQNVHRIRDDGSGAA